MTASRTRAMLLLGLAFGLGLFAGGAGMAVAARSGKVEIDRRGTNGRGGGWGWMRELDLSETQRDSIMGIYRRDGEGVDSLMRSIRPQTDSLFDLIRPEVDARRAETRRQVRTILTPIQQERYDSMVQAYDAERQKMREQSRSGQGGSRANR
jgi:Spy/CpxP family protein refolding chaperone